MRTSTAGVMLVILLVGCGATARAEDYEPSYERIRAGLARGSRVEAPRIARAAGRSARILEGPEPTRRAPARVEGRRNGTQAGGRDSVWNGLLIGAGIGVGGGFVWARNLCGSNDSECFAIAAPVGVLGGAGIGAAAGALLDALHR